MSKEPELSQLMQKAQDGDGASYMLLLRQIRELLLPFVRSSLARLGLKAEGGEEDILQNILLGLHLKRANYDPAQEFLPWMYAIARYKIIDHARKQKRENWAAMVSIEDNLLEFESDLYSSEKQKADIQQFLPYLSDKQSRLLKLVKIDGYSIIEASQQTGFSVSDIKVSIHRAIQVLQKKIREGA